MKLYELPHWLDDILYPQAMKDWWIEQTDKLNEDYQYYRNERKRWIVNEESLEALRHQFKMDGEAENKNTCAFDDRLEAIENGIPEWTAISNLTDRLEALEHIHKLENIADESPPVSFDRTDEKGYWWCPIHGKVTREHNCEGFYHDVPVNEFGVTEPCWEELEHRTDEKGGTRPPDEHHELQDFADKRTAPGEQKAEKVYIDDLLSLPPDEQKDELRCIDCGEKARAVNTRNGFCYVCEHNNHTTTAFYPTKASAKAAYRKLIDDRAIADRARAEDRRLNEDCTDYTPWPIREIVKALAGATTHLFDTHDCDIHGYELWKCALEAANKYLAPLNPNYAQMVTDDEEALEDA